MATFIYSLYPIITIISLAIYQCESVQNAALRAPSYSPPIQETMFGTLSGTPSITNPTNSPSNQEWNDPTIDPVSAPSASPPLISPTTDPTIDSISAPSVSPPVATPIVHPTSYTTTTATREPTKVPIYSTTTPSPITTSTASTTKNTATTQPITASTEYITKHPTSAPVATFTVYPTNDPTSNAPTIDPTPNTLSPTSDPTPPSTQPTTDPTADPTADPTTSKPSSAPLTIYKPDSDDDEKDATDTQSTISIKSWFETDSIETVLLYLVIIIMGLCLIISCIAFYFYKRHKDRELKRMALSGGYKFKNNHIGLKSQSVASLVSTARSTSTPITSTPIPMTAVSSISCPHSAESMRSSPQPQLSIPPIKSLPDDMMRITSTTTNNEGDDVKNIQIATPGLQPIPNNNISNLLNVAIPDNNGYVGVRNAVEMTPISHSTPRLIEEKVDGHDCDEDMYNNPMEDDIEDMYGNIDDNEGINGMMISGNTAITPKGKVAHWD